MGRPVPEGHFGQYVGNFSGVPQARTVLGVPWMNRDGIRECIPRPTPSTSAVRPWRSGWRWRHERTHHLQPGTARLGTGRRTPRLARHPPAAR